MTFAQMIDLGMSAREIEARTASGWLIQRHARVYALGHVPASRRSRFVAAVLALGPDAALSCRAAGAYWALVRGSVPTEVTVPTANGRRHRDGIIVHRSPLPARHVTIDGGLRVTTVLRTLLDLAAVLKPYALARAFEQAQVLHGLDPTLLAAEVVSRRGYRGSARLAEMLDDAVDPAAVRSVLELRFLKLCATHGLPRPQVNVRIGGWIPDFFWPEAGLIVETDGQRFHRTAAARRRDALKDEFMRALGLTVIRLRWTDVADTPEATAALIGAALAR